MEGFASQIEIPLDPATLSHPTFIVAISSVVGHLCTFNPEIPGVDGANAIGMSQDRDAGGVLIGSVTITSGRGRLSGA